MYVFAAFSRWQGDSCNVDDVKKNRETKLYVKWKQSLMKNECHKSEKKKKKKTHGGKDLL